MRHRRTKWVTTAGIGLLLLGYVAGRRHQYDTVEACMTLAASLDLMLRTYETANTVMWDAIGALARPEEQPGVVALPASDDLQ